MLCCLLIAAIAARAAWAALRPTTPLASCDPSSAACETAAELGAGWESPKAGRDLFPGRGPLEHFNIFPPTKYKFKRRENAKMHHVATLDVYETVQTLPRGSSTWKFEHLLASISMPAVQAQRTMS